MRTSGMTLIELVVVVAIVSVLATMATSNYGKFVLRANRAAARTALQQIALAQERHHLRWNVYAANLATPNGQPPGLGIESTANGLYVLQIQTANAETFIAEATAPATSPQFNDTDCRTFTIDSAGQRTAKSADGFQTTAFCWR